MSRMDLRFAWVLRGAGALTLTLMLAAFAPQMALRLTFGAGVQGGLAEVIVRSWGMLVGLVGAGMIFAAGHPTLHRFAAGMAVLGKLWFIGLLLTLGRGFLPVATGSLIIDSSVVMALSACLYATRGRARV